MGNYKGGYGYAPFIAAIDYSDAYGGEVLACRLPPGNAEANEAAAHIALFDDAVAVLPAEFFDDNGQLISNKILVRADSAGASREAEGSGQTNPSLKFVKRIRVKPLKGAKQTVKCN